MLKLLYNKITEEVMLKLSYNTISEELMLKFIIMKLLKK